jgi:hypothetical protein
MGRGRCWIYLTACLSDASGVRCRYSYTVASLIDLVIDVLYSSALHGLVAGRRETSEPPHMLRVVVSSLQNQSSCAGGSCHGMGVFGCQPGHRVQVEELHAAPTGVQWLHCCGRSMLMRCC